MSLGNVSINIYIKTLGQGIDNEMGEKRLFSYIRTNSCQLLRELRAKEFSLENRGPDMKSMVLFKGSHP